MAAVANARRLAPTVLAATLIRFLRPRGVRTASAEDSRRDVTVETVRPYGKPAAMVFKGKRSSGKGTLYDYVVEFGPGVSMPYAIRLEADGKIAGFALD
ncbi:MAG TPA: hypothetical protein VGC30_07775 [Dokdonella sp.]